MNSSDVLFEHFAVRGFISAPSDNVFIEQGQDALFYTDPGLYQDGLNSDHQYPTLAKGQPNRLQSFEHSFGWIRNVTADDLSNLSHGFLSVHEAAQSRLGSYLDYPESGNQQTCPPGWDLFPTRSKEQLKGSRDPVGIRYSGEEAIGEGAAREGITRVLGMTDSPSPSSSPGYQSSGSLVMDCNNGTDIEHPHEWTRHHSEPNVFEASSCQSLSVSGHVDDGPLLQSHSEALLALPVFKQESLESGFQYILSVATSPASKMNEETVTYLNQGQPYELKLRKYGDFSEIKGRTLKSIIRVVFHDRRLQYMEREQLKLWRRTRPGERILDIDIPLSYSVQNVKVEPSKLNAIEFTWDPAKDTGVFIKVNSISTEFTAKKHGGEKGVPFRVQVETYVLDDEDYRLAHCSSCQVKVFKPKGADRKHKTDREKMEKRSDAEKEKYQPSYECTVLAEIPLEQALQYLDNIKQQASSMDTDNVFSRDCPFQRWGSVRAGSSTPQHQRAGSDVSDNSDNPMTPIQASGSPPLRNFHYIADSSSNDARGDLPKTSSWGSFNGDVSGGNSWVPKIEDKKPETPSNQVPTLLPTANSGQVSNWLKNNRFAGYVSTFSNFSGADLLRLSRDDLVQICGLADGIRLDNALQSKTVRPRLTVYVCQGNPGTSTGQHHSTTSVGTSGSWPGVPLLPSVLPVPQTSPGPVGDPRPALHSVSPSLSSLSSRSNAANGCTAAIAPHQDNAIQNVYTDLSYNTALNGNHSEMLWQIAHPLPIYQGHSSHEVTGTKYPSYKKLKQSKQKYSPNGFRPDVEKVITYKNFLGKSNGYLPTNSGPNQLQHFSHSTLPRDDKNGYSGNYHFHWNPNFCVDASSYKSNGLYLDQVKHCLCGGNNGSAFPQCDCQDGQPMSMSRVPWMPDFGEESQQSLLSFLFAGEGDWEDRDGRGHSGSSTSDWGGLVPSGTKKSDSHHSGGNTDEHSKWSSQQLASPGGAVRQLFPCGPSPSPKDTSPSPKDTMHRHQDTSPCGSGEPIQSRPTTSVGSPSSIAIPLKYKRQLVEDLDSEDQDEEKIVTSTKKQRTRPLELSRKEVFHAIFMEQATVDDLIQKLAGLFSIAVKQIVEIYLVGPNNIDVLVTDGVVQNFKDQSRFALEATLVDNTHDQYKLHMQPIE